MKTIKLKTMEYTSIEDLVRINKELGEKAEKGLLMPLRMEKNLLELAEPSINGIWEIFLNNEGNIQKIVLW